VRREARLDVDVRRSPLDREAKQFLKAHGSMIRCRSAGPYQAEVAIGGGAMTDWPIRETPDGGKLANVDQEISVIAAASGLIACPATTPA
jgi:hypothetical protein